MLTNFDLDISTLVLCESNLLAEFPEASMEALRSESDNTPTVSWIMRGASTINLVVEYLICIHALHSRRNLLNPLVFYHPIWNNPMDDDAFFLINLPDNPFLSHVSSTYP